MIGHPNPPNFNQRVFHQHPILRSGVFDKVDSRGALLMSVRISFV